MRIRSLDLMLIAAVTVLVTASVSCSKSDGEGTNGGGGDGGTWGSSTASGNGCGACGDNQHCDTATNTCVCDPGFVMQAGVCTPADPGDPASRTEQEVCDAWKQGHVVMEQNPLTASGDMCDPGVLSPGAFIDTLVRINMFRWLAGLGPTTDDAAYNIDAQKCANLEAWWDFNSSNSPHQPPTSATCYTPEGAAAAGESNIAWGSGDPAQAIDQFMEDNGNATTMGHRRWLVNPPLGPVGIGFWKTGGMFGNAECLRIFGTQGNGPHPEWYAVPNQGFVPIQMAQWIWTFHGSIGGIPNAIISVLRVDDNTSLQVNVQTLAGGYAEDAISWTPAGWSPEVGKTYRVTVSGLASGDISYDVRPVACN